jgi:hypothetical protein
MTKLDANFPRQIPLSHQADVVVVGAGPGGLGAALFSARCGYKTLLVEQYGLPGGMAVSAEVHPFMRSHCQGDSLDAPVYPEWIAAMQRYLPTPIVEQMRQGNGYWERSINKEAAALGAEDLLLEAGVEVLYHHRLCLAEVENRRIRSLVLHRKDGFCAVQGKMFVDCSGDGDLAALAKCRYEKGNGDGWCQPMTLCFKLSHVNAKYLSDDNGTRIFDPAWRRMLTEKFQEALGRGQIKCPRENVLIFPFQLADEGVIHFNTTRVVKLDATNGIELSQAEIEGRRQLREILFWLRSEIPDFENCRLMSMGVQIGVRESRRILGRAYLQREDFDQCRKFPDAIARCSYSIDIHSPTGAGTVHAYLPNDEFYEIPYGCIVPADCDNLTIGGRPVSADVAVHSSLRIMPTAVSLGQAAGLAAAMACEQNCSPADLSGIEVRKRLKDMGARL